MKNLLPERPFEIVVIGCSAGGIDALMLLLPQIRPPFRPAVVVVQHVSPTPRITLADFFSKLCHVPVKEAEDKEAIVGGTIYFAPAGYHLLVERQRTFALNVDLPVQFARPSIDVTLESVAGVYGESAIGFILTGSNGDGADGLRELQRRGGVVAVQKPETAEFSFMPAAALAATNTLFVLTLSEIRDVIAGLGQEPYDNLTRSMFSADGD